MTGTRLGGAMEGEGAAGCAADAQWQELVSVTTLAAASHTGAVCGRPMKGGLDAAG